MTLQQSILATLCYHDIFNYPLTSEEIHKFLTEKTASRQSILKGLENLKKSSKIEKIGKYYTINKRRKIVSIRKSRQKYSQLKLKKAEFYASILKIIPTLKFVGVSGALAMNNSHKDDDIDLVLITSKGTLWTTRFLVNITLWPFKRKPLPADQALIAAYMNNIEKPQGKLRRASPSLITNNKACLNVFLDKSDLKIRPHNLYLAHEIAQMKPLWNRDNIYQKFIEANPWTKRYLPNWQSLKTPPGWTPLSGDSPEVEAITTNSQLSILESFLKKFQLYYMRKRISTERIEEHQLFFHPQNTADWVMNEYQKRFSTLSFPRLPRRRSRKVGNQN